VLSAESGGARPVTNQPRTSPSVAAGGAVKASVVSSRDIAAELARNDRVIRRMTVAAQAAKYLFGAWNAYDILSTAARAMNMAATTYARGSPYWQAIQQARNLEERAREIDAFYGSLNVLKNQMPFAGGGNPEWDSYHDLYQLQLVYLGIEDQLREALESVIVARSYLDGQMSDLEDFRGGMDELIAAAARQARGGQIGELRDAMAEKISAAVLMPMTSLELADATFFADAGGQMNASMVAARDHYISAREWIKHHGLMTRAAIKGLEIRMRELGAGGAFAEIADDALRSAPLNRFAFPH
jgi:hypothetical protein